MKKPLKFSSKLFGVFTLLLVLSFQANAQINEGGTYQFYTCKDRKETYVYYGSSDPNSLYCATTWTVVGGVFEGIVGGANQTTFDTYTDPSTGRSQVDVKWTTDDPTGTISVTSSCSNGNSSKTITFQTNPTVFKATPSSINQGSQTTLTATPQFTAKSITWTGDNLITSTGPSITAKPSVSTTYSSKVNFDASLAVNSTVVKTINCNQIGSVYVKVIPAPPVTNNTITASGSTSFYTSGDPTTISGSTPTGGNGISYTYQWQLSTGSGFSNITGATAINYDPPAIQVSSSYRRLVTSVVNTIAVISYSNVVVMTIWKLGSVLNNPIIIGDINYCSTYENVVDNSPSNGYGNDYGNPTDDIFYKFNLTVPAKVTLQNCKSDGVAASFYLLNSAGSGIQSNSSYPCDVGSELNFELQPGTYYIVTEGPVGENMHSIPIYLWVSPIVVVSSNITISAGSSTTLTASGATSYTWSPSTGLNLTSGASVSASPAVTTMYTVQGSMGCGRRDSKTVVVTVTGAVGSTRSNPIVVSNIGGCGYTSPELNSTGYGNDYGLSSEDIYYKFTTTTSSEIDFDAYAEIPMHFILLNSSGGLIDQQYYGFVDSGDDAGSYDYVALDGTPLRPTLQAGTYYLVAEGINGNGAFRVGIQTPAGFSCRKATEPPIEKSHVPKKRITYPNPAKNVLDFNLEKDSPALVSIVNSKGITVCESIILTNSSSIAIDHLPMGLYLINIRQDNKIIREKVLIER